VRRSRRKWERCPVCGERVAQVGAMVTVELLIRIADHVNSGRHVAALRERASVAEPDDARAERLL
jgi:cytochrome c-type biogenesis protein CcmH/NrfF